ncbi:site-specific integrase [Rhizomicrobium electricum]|uniref:Site-specific integrase n=1 Tax=Rhizomicrobium electricum TaxID=480070 RepID=A0ABP3QCS4_9PROT|nr:site-specific integrase [Rhizomicrobium electricum]NIJ46714.1 integrase [Rhizomicrobium electricum]
MGRGKSGAGVEVRTTSIRLRFYFEGKRRTETLNLKPTATNIQAAYRLAHEIRQDIDRGIFDYAATFPDSEYALARKRELEALQQNEELARKEAEERMPLFSDYVATWLATLACEKATADGYRTQLTNFWIAEFKAKRLDEIKHTDIAKAAAKKALEVSAKTVNNLLIPLRALFAAAVADDLVEKSPVDRVHNRKHQRPPIDPFEREEMEMIVTRMRECYPEVVYAYYEFAFSTGLRTSELIALRWGSIDWHRKKAMISRARVRHKDKGTKTHHAREIDLHERAIAALVVMKKHTLLKGMNEPVFCHPNGKPWPSDRIQREEYFYPVLKDLGLRQRRAYNTRHTYATLALMSGVNPAYVAKQLGHTDTTMLFKHYARWIEGADKGAEARKMDAALAKKLVLPESGTR